MMKKQNTASAKKKKIYYKYNSSCDSCCFGSYLGHSDCVDYYDQL